jgi:hypothetical protein
LWLVGDDAQGFSWFQEDTDDIKPGWHHFAIRWDHDKPVFEVLLDGDKFIEATDYLK